MSRTGVFIWGSCVSRDTFEHVDPSRHELVRYLARQSAVSAASPPVALVKPPHMHSPFQRRMIAGDFRSTLKKHLAARAAETDVLLVDLVDERLGFYVLPDDTVVTRSVELIQAGDASLLPDGTRHLPLGDPEHFERWSTAIGWAGRLIRRKMPEASVVLLDIPWAQRSSAGNPTPRSFGVRASEANESFRPYADRAQEALRARRIALPHAEVTSGPTHPWGESPFHYSEDVYLRVVEELTGEPGRAVWARDALMAQR